MLSKAFLVRGDESVRLSVVRDWFPRPIDIVYVEPYLSLNREEIRIDIPNLFDLNKIDQETTQPCVVDIEWTPPARSEIVVNDVDEAFEIVQDHPPRTTLPVIFFVRDILGTSSIEQWYHGLPLYILEVNAPPPKQRWLRRSDERAYGKYRHTYTFVYQG